MTRRKPKGWDPSTGEYLPILGGPLRVPAYPHAPITPQGDMSWLGEPPAVRECMACHRLVCVRDACLCDRCAAEGAEWNPL